VIGLDLENTFEQDDKSQHYQERQQEQYRNREESQADCEEDYKEKQLHGEKNELERQQQNLQHLMTSLFVVMQLRAQ
jgi:hypothetical protein